MKRFFCNRCEEPMTRDRIARCEKCAAVSTERRGDDTQIMGYGQFPGGDPRNYFPDMEMSSPEEHAEWERACREAEADPTKRNLPPGALRGLGVYQ